MLFQLHRWRSAHLDVEVPVFAELYVPICDRLPQLGLLTLNTCVEEENTVQLFEDCPLLTKVVLSSGAVSIPGAQIRELQSYYYAEHLQIPNKFGTCDGQACYPSIVRGDTL